MFYDPAPKGVSGDRDIIRPRRQRYTTVREKLAEWVRKIGITDTEVQPNHGWPHTFKRIAARCMPERVSDEITGHTQLTVGRGYGRPTVDDMAEALKPFPRYKLD